MSLRVFVPFWLSLNSAKIFLLISLFLNEILILPFSHRGIIPLLSYCEHEQVSVKIFPFIARRTRHKIEFNYLSELEVLWNSISPLKFIPIDCYYVILLDFGKLFYLLDRPYLFFWCLPKTSRVSPNDLRTRNTNHQNPSSQILRVNI